MAKETVESLCQRAQTSISQGDNEEAMRLYRQALAVRPDHPDVHYGMATVCYLVGDLDQASQHFKEVTRLDPLRAGAYINLGAVYNRMERFDDAIPALRRGIQLDMNRAEGYYNLGLVYRKKQQLDMAIQAYREATRINPRMADAHYNIANIYFEKMQYNLAVAHYREALEIRPNWEKALRGMEQAQVALGQMQDTQHDAPATQTGPSSAVLAQATGPPQAPVDPERMVDANLHGEILRNMHRATIDSDNHGRQLLENLEKEIEPAIKELSSCLLYPDSSANELNHCIRKFEVALEHLRRLQSLLRVATEKVRVLGETLLKT